MFKRWPLLLVLLIPLALGCDEDAVITGNEDNPDPDPYPRATTPDILIDNLVRAYGERNYAEYEAMLHSGFIFYLSDEDVGAGLDGRLDRARELEATFSLFNGEPGQQPDGSVQPPVQSIVLELTPFDPEWTDDVPEDFIGTMLRRYDAQMDVTYTNGDVSEVVGRQEFYVQSVSYDDGEGTNVTAYQIRFWRDLGIDGLKSTTEVSWGSLKMMF